MPDGATGSGEQTAQRGFRGRFPGGRFPQGRFPRRFPIRRRFPRPVFPIIVPPFYGFPIERCYYIDRFGRCCDRFGRCIYRGYYPYMAEGPSDSWYGAGTWDMMPDIDTDDDMDSVTVYNDFVDYDD